MQPGYLGWNLHAASSASSLLHQESPSMLQMSHNLSLIGCHSLLTREVADSPTKSNVTFETGSALFQIPTIPQGPT